MKNPFDFTEKGLQEAITSPNPELAKLIDEFPEGIVDRFIFTSFRTNNVEMMELLIEKLPEKTAKHDCSFFFALRHDHIEMAISLITYLNYEDIFETLKIFYKLNEDFETFCNNVEDKTEAELITPAEKIFKKILDYAYDNTRGYSASNPYTDDSKTPITPSSANLIQTEEVEAAGCPGEIKNEEFA